MASSSHGIRSDITSDRPRWWARKDKDRKAQSGPHTRQDLSASVQLTFDSSQVFKPRFKSLPARGSSFSGPAPPAPSAPPPALPTPPSQAYPVPSPAFSLSSGLKPNSLPLPAALQNKTYVSPVGASAYGPPVSSLNYTSPQPYPGYGSVERPPSPSQPGASSSEYYTSPYNLPPIPPVGSSESPYYSSPYKPPKLDAYDDDYTYVPPGLPPPTTNAAETVNTSGATYGTAPTQGSTAPYQSAPYQPAPYPTETYGTDRYRPTSYQEPFTKRTSHEEPSTQPAPRPPVSTTVSSHSVLETVVVNDGADSQSFTSAPALGQYLRLFPEADNDQSCRMIKYGSQCATDLLMELFDHFEFSRYSLFPYGLAGNFSFNDSWGSGSCNCQKCLDGQLCGHFVLHKNLRFFVYQKTTPSSSKSPSISSATGQMLIDAGGSQYQFIEGDWNLQFFRVRSRKYATTLYATDALIYQNYDGPVKVKSTPLDYVFAQLNEILTNWEVVLEASTKFLSSFRIEVLEERLETDRSIIRNLLVAAQHWEGYRLVLQSQLQRIDFLKNVFADPRWTEGRDNVPGLGQTASSYIDRFRNIDHKITTELMQETDNLVQRITNLITIDEGYRSRDQNQSIRRLTWITFIFLPLVFTASIFSMQIDIFKENVRWQFYIYTSLVVTFVVFGGYAVLRFRRRFLRLCHGVLASLLDRLLRRLAKYAEDKKGVESTRSLDDLEKQTDSSSDTSTILKWAASSGRTDIILKILQGSNNKKKAFEPSLPGPALMLAIKNGHSEAATILIEAREGLTHKDEQNATVLHWAAKMGQAKICQTLLEKGVFLGAKDENDQTALDWAMRGDDEATINILLRGGRTFTRQETANLQSLHFSARSGDIEVIKEFYRQGSSLEARDGKGQTVLFHAVKGKQHEIVRWLLREGRANVQAVDKEGLSPLHVAAQSCDETSAEILLDHGANVNALSNSNQTPLHCIPHDEGVRTLVLFHERGAKMEAADKNRNTFAHLLAAKGDSAALIFKIATDLGIDVTSTCTQGNTPAHVAAESGSREILRILREKSVDLSAVRNKTGCTPLMLAARAAQTGAMSFLLTHGASFDGVDSDGRSLLELTVSWGNPHVMAVLQAHGADYSNIRGSDAENAAHPVWKAVYEGHSATVAKILDDGLSTEYEHRGVRILQAAIESHNDEVAGLLLDRGATVTAPDTRGWTALHSAAYAGDVNLLIRVLERLPPQTATTATFNKSLGGPKTDEASSPIAKAPIDHQGWTPLDLAAFYRHDDCVKVLDPDGQVTEYAWSRISHFQINAGHYTTPPILCESVVEGFVEAAGRTNSGLR